MGVNRILSTDFFNESIYAGTDYGIYKIKNEGLNWTATNIGLLDHYVNIVAVFDTIIYAFSGNGPYRSLNNGESWELVNSGLEELECSDLVFFGQDIFITNNNGVFLSSDFGSSWHIVDQNLPNDHISGLTILDSFLYVGTSRTGVWKLSIPEMIVSVEENTIETPTNYILNQNYPNPFNPSTTISFSLPNKEFVTLKIYDALGKEITTLVNEELNAGSYKNDWNAGNLSSGIYFYRLQAGKYSETKKLILLK